ncbi:MAG: ATP-binding protein, partial [Lawsonibacter sp.]|nr:ATP-binding protein [Lawsonibacter sp.]
PQRVEFGPDGLPAGPKQEGHGLGLQSVRSVTDKYGGLFRCQWENGSFLLRAVLIPPVQERRKNFEFSPISAAIFCVLLALILLNCLPSLAQALEAIPVLGLIVRVVDLRTYPLLWKN